MQAYSSAHKAAEGRRSSERTSSTTERPAPATAALLALQRSAGNAAVARALDAPGVQRSSVTDVLRSGGSPLADPVRQEMELRFGADFSDVRVHADRASRESAKDLGARAYTMGNHIVVGERGADEHTLAHELTHVIQQRQGPVAGADRGGGVRVSDPGDRFERAAEDNARRVMRAQLDPSPPASETAVAPTEATAQRAVTVGGVSYTATGENKPAALWTLFETAGVNDELAKRFLGRNKYFTSNDITAADAADLARQIVERNRAGATVNNVGNEREESAARALPGGGSVAKAGENAPFGKAISDFVDYHANQDPDLREKLDDHATKQPRAVKLDVWSSGAVGIVGGADKAKKAENSVRIVNDLLEVAASHGLAAYVFQASNTPADFLQTLSEKLGTRGHLMVESAPKRWTPYVAPAPGDAAAAS